MPFPESPHFSTSPANLVWSKFYLSLYWNHQPWFLKSADFQSTWWAHIGNNRNPKDHFGWASATIVVITVAIINWVPELFLIIY